MNTLEKIEGFDFGQNFKNFLIKPVKAFCFNEKINIVVSFHYDVMKDLSKEYMIFSLDDIKKGLFLSKSKKQIDFCISVSINTDDFYIFLYDPEDVDCDVFIPVELFDTIKTKLIEFMCFVHEEIKKEYWEK